MSYSLDEIILALDSSAPTEFYKDTVKYLKEYRDIVNKDNIPLAWEELRQMENEPVWVIDKYTWNDKDVWSDGSWEVISSVWEEEWDDDPYLSMTDECFYHKNDLGETWKAYRKKQCQNH